MIGINENEFSLLREKFVEHRFISDVLERLWRYGYYDVEVLHSESDNAGYDLVMTCNRVTSYIQLKSILKTSRNTRHKIHARLAEKQNALVVLAILEKTEDNIKIEYKYCKITRVGFSKLKSAKHSKGDSKGEKKIRRNVRIVNAGKFDSVNIDGLLTIMFDIKLKRINRQ